jgi:hypothetical protein
MIAKQVFISERPKKLYDMALFGVGGAETVDRAGKTGRPVIGETVVFRAEFGSYRSRVLTVKRYTKT